MFHGHCRRSTEEIIQVVYIKHQRRCDFWAQCLLCPLCSWVLQSIKHSFDARRVYLHTLWLHTLPVFFFRASPIIYASCTLLLTDSSDFSFFSSHPSRLPASCLRGRIGVIITSNGTWRLAPRNLDIWRKLKVIFNNCADEWKQADQSRSLRLTGRYEGDRSDVLCVSSGS